MTQEENGTTERIRVGLCADCKHMRRLVSERGSTFYMCQLGLSQPEFPKYPRLPVLHCEGYERVAL